ncbi:MAG: hypothetical protein C4308_10590 [Chitinophagaceae bacterium]
MTLQQVYDALESKTFYDAEGRRFSFVNNSIGIDRKALIPFLIYKEEESFILSPEKPFAAEKDLRIEIGEVINFYGKEAGEKLLTLA